MSTEHRSDSRPPWLGGRLNGSTTWRVGQRRAEGGSAEAAGGRRAGGPRPPAAPPGPPSSAPRVLIVDDVRRVREAMRDLLELEGIQIVGEAADGQAAVAAVRRHDPDVTLMDWRMPVLDGLQATRQITQLGLRTKVIVCTAFDGPAIHDQAKAAGAFDVIAKGEHPRKIIELVKLAWRAQHTAQ